MRIAVIALAVCVALAVLGCASQKPPSGENYYVQATKEYSEHYYRPSIEDYQKLIDQYPFSPYAAGAELRIGLAYYRAHDYAEAAGTLDDFRRMHPTSSDMDVASYFLAMSNFRQIGRPDQDQTHTRIALAQFETLERRYPESDFAQLAHQQIVICREMLARHEYLIGNFYLSRANLKAAESRFAELEARYPNTPISPEALYALGKTLKKQGKNYSAAQAFEALKLHYPNTKFAVEADNQLKGLKQPVNTEEDPLRMVLAESGYDQGSLSQDNGVTVRENLAGLNEANASGAYGPDGLPILDPQPDRGGILASRRKPGPATLQTIRLSPSKPPMSVIFELTGPVEYDQKLKKGEDFSTLTVFLKGVQPAKQLAHRLVFDESIFQDCEIDPSPGGTKVVLHTAPVSRFAIIPLHEPSRLLVTFIPSNGTAVSQAGSFGSSGAEF